jgi:hypothetical protein
MAGIEIATGELVKEEQLVDSACMYYRHDFGLMGPTERDKMRFEAKEWIRAWEKALQDWKNRQSR